MENRHKPIIVKRFFSGVSFNSSAIFMFTSLGVIRKCEIRKCELKIRR